jgi:hypothetical protein
VRVQRTTADMYVSAGPIRPPANAADWGPNGPDPKLPFRAGVGGGRSNGFGRRLSYIIGRDNRVRQTPTTSAPW